MALISDHVYLLPDGRELVARHSPTGDSCLLDLSRGVASAPVHMEDGSGRLLSWERHATWSVSDLRDTGRVVRPEMQRLVLW